jgi:WXG100 protein secretion system (Wss), protein YukD
MPNEPLERIHVVIATTMGTGQWDADLPIDVPVQALITRLIDSPSLPFRRQNEAGITIPYRLMWKEGDRYLVESETLREASVQAGHTLVMAQEARAGTTGRAAMDQSMTTGS